jgi:hypothetical protein
VQNAQIDLRRPQRLLRSQRVVRQPEVAGGEQVRAVMHLIEEHLLRRSVQGTPLLDAPLQRPQLPVGELAREAAL